MTVKDMQLYGREKRTAFQESVRKSLLVVTVDQKPGRTNFLSGGIYRMKWTGNWTLVVDFMSVCLTNRVGVGTSQDRWGTRYTTVYIPPARDAPPPKRNRRTDYQHYVLAKLGEFYPNPRATIYHWAKFKTDGRLVLELYFESLPVRGLPPIYCVHDMAMDLGCDVKEKCVEWTGGKFLVITIPKERS